jgi:outer membrane phospholipase A
LSFKFQFFPSDAPLVESVHFLRHLYLGYTQTSLWDVRSSSAPFQDSSYKPRLFFFDPTIWEADDQAVALGLETGLGHESNGKALLESRSINFAYVKPLFVLGPPKGWHVTAAPMFVDYLSKSGNPDIAEYRGHVDLELSLLKHDRWRLTGLFRKGDIGYSTEINFAYPLRIVALGNLNGYFLVQYFNGYGESILDYNQRVQPQLRFGLMLAP